MKIVCHALNMVNIHVPNMDWVSASFNILPQGSEQWHTLEGKIPPNSEDNNHYWMTLNCLWLKRKLEKSINSSLIHKLTREKYSVNRWARKHFSHQRLLLDGGFYGWDSVSTICSKSWLALKRGVQWLFACVQCSVLLSGGVKSVGSRV